MHRCLMRLGTLAILAVLAIAPPAAATEDDFNVWTGQFAIVDVDPSGKWFVRGEAQERFTNDAGRLGQLLLRSLVGYRLDNRASIGAGYAFIFTNPSGAASSNEHRVYQELNFRLISTAGGLTLDARSRLEQRFFEEGGATGWRYRQFVQLRAPIGDRKRFVAYTEPFVGLNETRFNRPGLAIWRNFAGVALPLGEGIEIVPGYLNQYVVRDGQDRIDHTANFNLFLNF